MYFSEGDKEGATLHKALSVANKKAEADAMLVEALTLIKTGAVPEVKEDVKVEQESPAQRAAAARPGKFVLRCQICILLTKVNLIAVFEFLVELVLSLLAQFVACSVRIISCVMFLFDVLHF